jgi:hypothetical protein
MSKKKDLENLGFDPIKYAHDLGLQSKHAYTLGFASIGLTFLAWLVSRGKKDDRAQSDRWGLFVGHWAPTFFAIGIALRQEER